MSQYWDQWLLHFDHDQRIWSIEEVVAIAETDTPLGSDLAYHYCPDGVWTTVEATDAISVTGLDRAWLADQVSHFYEIYRQSARALTDWEDFRVAALLLI